jgi:hypothetical protein
MNLTPLKKEKFKHSFAACRRSDTTMMAIRTATADNELTW